MAGVAYAARGALWTGNHGLMAEAIGWRGCAAPPKTPCVGGKWIFQKIVPGRQPGGSSKPRTAATAPIPGIANPAIPRPIPRYRIQGDRYVKAPESRPHPMWDGPDETVGASLVWTPNAGMTGRMGTTGQPQGLPLRWGVQRRMALLPSPSRLQYALLSDSFSGQNKSVLVQRKISGRRG